MLKKNKKIRIYVFLILFTIALLFLFFNEFGIVKYLELKSETKSLDEQISTINKEGKKLELEIDSLKRKVPAKIEKVARENYGMKREGEKVIKVKEK